MAEREYLLRGITCADCAAKIENALQKEEGISDASYNLISSTLRVEHTNDVSSQLTATVKRMVKKYEPDVVVTEKGNQNSHDYHHMQGEEETGKKDMIFLVVGAAIFTLGLILDYVSHLPASVILSIFLVAYVMLGGTVVGKALRNLVREKVFDENFLMSIATIGAILTRNYPEAVAVMLFYRIGEYFQEMAVRRSKKSIAELMDIRPDHANLKQGDDIIRVSPDAVQVGDRILVKPGERIPLDGVVREGQSLIDTTALTGESVPRRASIDDVVLSGTINQSGVLTIEVSKTFGDSTVAKIIDLVENSSSKKAPTEHFITTFSRYYTPIVVGLAALLAFIPPLFFAGQWSDWIHRGLIFLVISCPCALVISIPLSFFGGIGGASRKGILVKGSNYLEALNHLETVVFDKTGTMTKGIFKVLEIHPANGCTNDELLEITALAETMSNHPIAQSIKSTYGKELDHGRLTHYNEIAGHGISVLVDGKKVLVGNGALMRREGVPFSAVDRVGTVMYVAVDEVFAGSIVVGDELKEDGRTTIAALKERGVRKTVMLTGDDTQVAQAVACELGVDEVYAHLLPDQKVEEVERLSQQKSPKGKLAFIGDGINDAPVLARSDIGIAMGGLGSDAAIEAADIVLMTDEPSKLIEAIDIARFTRRVVWQNIIFALGVKAVFLLLGAMGVASMWEAVFADVGVSLLAILNALRIGRHVS